MIDFKQEIYLTLNYTLSESRLDLATFLLFYRQLG